MSRSRSEMSRSRSRSPRCQGSPDSVDTADVGSGTLKMALVSFAYITAVETAVTNVEDIKTDLEEHVEFQELAQELGPIIDQLYQFKKKLKREYAVALSELAPDDSDAH